MWSDQVISRKRQTVTLAGAATITIFVTAKVLSWQNTFSVTANTYLSQQTRDKTFIVTKIVITAAPATDRTEAHQPPANWPPPHSCWPARPSPVAWPSAGPEGWLARPATLTSDGRARWTAPWALHSRRTLAPCAAWPSRAAVCGAAAGLGRRREKQRLCAEMDLKWAARDIFC